uniref:Uncharacterized protein n=1 Tax=Rhizophora mucronata TaxID=61149 RepID=A0A2P2QGL8_RHIMU
MPQPCKISSAGSYTSGTIGLRTPLVLTLFSSKISAPMATGFFFFFPSFFSFRVERIKEELLYLSIGLE